MKKLLALLLFLAFAGGLFAQENTEQKKNAIAVGLLTGGALIGLEYEYLAYNNFALTGGAGLLGFNGGVNYHLEPTTNSHFIHLGVNNVGFTGAVARYAELSFNARAFNFLQASIGGAYVFYVSDMMNDNYEDLTGTEYPDYMLTYSLAWYTSF
ncbi:MAG: hypothetical protein ACOC2H_01950 [Spirochaetota bacterium]